MARFLPMRPKDGVHETVSAIAARHGPVPLITSRLGMAPYLKCLCTSTVKVDRASFAVACDSFDWPTVPAHGHVACGAARLRIVDQGRFFGRRGSLGRGTKLDNASAGSSSLSCCTFLHCFALHCPALLGIALRCLALRCVALRCLVYPALHCTALHALCCL